MSLSKEQVKDMETLEGRDLMWFLLDLYEHNVIDGDNITQFLCDHINEETVKEYIKEEAT
tara:strand:- start:1463 stop:1642 length:180 start_codon:yes stop_codon:yes gene_type:complete